MTHAAAKHRVMDTELAERLARDGVRTCGYPGGALLPSRSRLRDLRTMGRPRVLLAKLSVRTSAQGRQYLSGWLGKASVVGFPGEADKFGNAVWDIFVSEPEPRAGTVADGRRERQDRVCAAVTRGVDLDDAIPF
jgi:hypothetical protein